jgi:hypothetical protein
MIDKARTDSPRLPALESGQWENHWTHPRVNPNESFIGTGIAL